MKMNDAQRDALVKAAEAVRKNAYAPYSNYLVGAAVLTDSGTVYAGVNVENAAYPSSICAERSAIFNAVSHGEQGIVAIAVVTENGGSPCGACRQVLAEFGEQIHVVIANAMGEVLSDSTLEDLLPHAFTAEELGRRNE
jgi:cytidine deaminase